MNEAVYTVWLVIKCQTLVNVVFDEPGAVYKEGFLFSVEEKRLLLHVTEILVKAVIPSD